MKTIVQSFALIVALSVNWSYSQSAYQDSLIGEYKKLKTVQERFDYALNKDYDNNLTSEESEFWLEEAFNQASFINDYEKQIKVLSYSSMFYSRLGNTEKAAEMIAYAKKYPQNKLQQKSKNLIKHAENDYYTQIQEFELAIECLADVITYHREQNDSTYIAIYLHNQAINYYQLGQLSVADSLLQEAYAINKKLGAYYQNYNLSMLGNIQDKLGNYDKALEYAKIGLENALASNDHYGSVAAQINIASILFNAGKSAEALALLEDAIEEAKKHNLLQWRVNAYKIQTKIYADKNDFEKAYNSLSLYMELNNEIINESSINQLAKVQQEIDANNIKMLEQEALSQQLTIDQQKIENEKKNILIYSGLGIASLIIVVLIFIWQGFVNKKKANEIILLQKKIVEEKNHEILDSINYAKRIQSAILPSAELINKYLPENFVLYKPKDIVAGDFYWMNSYENEKENGVLFAVADCTGHGVPGAMVSVVCNNALNRTVREYKIVNPGEVLDKTRALIIDEFSKSSENVKDGMDIALCSIENNTLRFAGANNPLWLVRKDSDEVLEIKGTKEPIGQYHNMTNFTTHTLSLNKGDQIYIFSDGYADQFGGENLPDGKPRGKKFKAQSLKKLLLSIRSYDMNKQAQLLNEALENWKGEFEQIDDICIMGVRF